MSNESHEIHQQTNTPVMNEFDSKKIVKRLLVNSNLYIKLNSDTYYMWNYWCLHWLCNSR